MKTRLCVAPLIILMLALLSAGCGGDGTNTEGQAVEQGSMGSETAGQLAEQAGEAFETVKKEYLAGAEKIVSEWDKKVGDLDAQVSSLPDMARKPLEDSYGTVKTQTEALHSSFGELEGAGQDTFDEKKAAFEQSVGDLTSGYDNLLGMLK